MLRLSFFIPIVGMMLLCACNQENQPATGTRLTAVIRNDSIILQAPDTNAMEEPEKWVDPMRAINDSIMEINVPVPALLGEQDYDSNTVNTFKKLARSLHGESKILASANLLNDQIQKILCSRLKDYADVVFLIDKTGSMSDDIEQVKMGLSQIMASLEERHDVRLAIGCYGDKREEPNNWFSFKNFETDYKQAKRFIDSIEVKNGGDMPESVYEAFFETSKQDFWKSTRARIIILIGDAPPLEKPDGEYTLDEVVAKAKREHITVNFFPLIVTPYQARYRSSDAAPDPATQTKLIETVFPNPTKGELNIKFTSEQKYRIEVFDLGGMRLIDQYVDNASWHFNIGFEPDGLYVVRVSDKNNQYDMAKFIIRH